MAIFHFTAKIGSRSSGANALAASAYPAAVKLECAETGQHFDYTRKAGVLHTEMVLPPTAPGWASDRGSFWNAVHKRENRKNSQLYRAFEIALPHELDFHSQRMLARQFCQHLAGLGMVADFAMHAPGRRSSKFNEHFHVQASTREFDEHGQWKKNKNRDWNSTEFLVGLREAWSDMCNEALAQHGFEQRISHKSLEDQAADALASGDELTAALMSRLPEPHMGHAAHALEQKAKKKAALENEEYRPVTRLGQMRQEAIEQRTRLESLIAALGAARTVVVGAAKAVRSASFWRPSPAQNEDKGETKPTPPRPEPDSSTEPGF